MRVGGWTDGSGQMSGWVDGQKDDQGEGRMVAGGRSVEGQMGGRMDGRARMRGIEARQKKGQPWGQIS